MFGAIRPGVLDGLLVDGEGTTGCPARWSLWCHGACTGGSRAGVAAGILAVLWGHYALHELLGVQAHQSAAGRGRLMPEGNSLGAIHCVEPVAAAQQPPAFAERLSCTGGQGTEP
jgi:hypothetical protein